MAEANGASEAAAEAAKRDSGPNAHQILLCGCAVGQSHTGGMAAGRHQ